MKTITVLMVLVGLCSDALAAPVKVPPLKICASASGNVLAKKKCSKAETQLTLEALQGQDGATGATAPAGAAGAPGILNVSACRIDSKTFEDTSWGWLAVDCGEGEFLFQHGIKAPETDNFYIQEIRLRAYEGDNFAAGVEYVIYGAENWKADVIIVCCPR